MVNKPDKNVSRLRRHRRVRGKISGTVACQMCIRDRGYKTRKHHARSDKFIVKRATK